MPISVPRAVGCGSSVSIEYLRRWRKMIAIQARTSSLPTSQMNDASENDPEPEKPDATAWMENTVDIPKQITMTTIASSGVMIVRVAWVIGSPALSNAELRVARAVHRSCWGAMGFGFRNLDDDGPRKKIGKRLSRRQCEHQTHLQEDWCNEKRRKIGATSSEQRIPTSGLIAKTTQPTV